jgi:DNA polymerase-3 subunit alpha/error-prone DNA polymerase
LQKKTRAGEFHSLRDFSRRVRLGRDDITVLCPAGVFDGISGGLARTMQAREFLKSTTGARGKSQDELFAPEEYHRHSSTGVLIGVEEDKP